jgi:ABC-type transport system involved in multi-copper enzyme maturation permease subunit
MRLFRAELLKMRHRTMTFVLLITMLVVMALVFLVIGSLVGGILGEVESLPGSTDFVPWRVGGAFVGDFVFGGLGTLLAVIYAGGIVGGDYSWGVLRNTIARGESRERYMLAKAAAIGLLVIIGAAITFVAGMVMIAIAATVSRFDLGALTIETLVQLTGGWGLGTLVLLERAAITIAVATMLRSQLAGIVVAVILYVAEPIIGGVLSIVGTFGPAFDPMREPTVHWSQFLPFSIGGSVAAEGYVSLPALVPQLTATVPLGQAVPVVLLYTAGALGLAMLVMRRQEIT